MDNFVQVLNYGLIKKGDIIYDIKKDKNNSIIKLNFLDLLQINLTSFYTFSDLEKDKDYIITDKSKKSFFIF